MTSYCDNQNHAQGVGRYTSESSLTGLSDSTVDTVVGGNHEEWVPLQPPTTDSEHILLTAWRSQPYRVVMKFTVEFVEALAYRPVKWLGYAAWCLHGFDGIIVDNKGCSVDVESEKLAPGMHYYFKPRNETAARAYHISTTMKYKRMLARVDGASSKTTTSNIGSSDFSADVKARDGGCVFSSHHPKECHASHLLPRRHGERMLTELQRFREEFITHGVGEMENINDRRNGITLWGSIHTHFDDNSLSILATPNPYIEYEDLRQADPTHAMEMAREQRGYREQTTNEPNVAQPKERQDFPPRRQYILHWFDWSQGTQRVREDEITHRARAAFHEHTSDDKLPLPNVCHYRYAVALMNNCVDNSVTTIPPEATDQHEDDGDHDGDYDGDYEEQQEEEEEEEEREESGSRKRKNTSGKSAPSRRSRTQLRRNPGKQRVGMEAVGWRKRSSREAQANSSTRLNCSDVCQPQGTPMARDREAGNKRLALQVQSMFNFQHRALAMHQRMNSVQQWVEGADCAS
ncbi:hypothetical protein K435DRAFT_810533 [Dendrothele bispora CBS 962.96]|uniref:HNH nuclease domain-containing protein n=1 Tax=Dendrothele bispora (strain CBS 962.96) TaxID=1314807 RepID=A0A4V4HBK3_DENBC|nr:hypothetical protein K435DRAFT_810533 [Dendrothele bispora CBS 962.96]